MTRLDKYLAHAGLGTRKEVKQLIRKKHVSVNDKIIIKDDQHIQDNDIVKVDGDIIQYESVVYIMLNKPNGVVSATKDALYETVLDCIDTILPPDCFPVGRLDLDSEGLLLITNDGILAHQLLSPKHHVDKTYYIEIEHALTSSDIHTIEDGGIQLDDVTLQPAKLEYIHECAYYITIQEGKFHQIKRMLQAVGNEVLYLKRIRMGSLCLDENLEVGKWRYLSDEEIQLLKNRI